MRRHDFIASVALLLVALPARTSRASTCDPIADLGYAVWLEDQGEYYRSASTFMGVFQCTTAGAPHDNAAVGIVRVHRRGRQWKETVLWGEKVGESELSPGARKLVAYEVSHALLRLDRPEDALRELERNAEPTPNEEDLCRHRLLTGFAHLTRQDIERARSVWSRPDRDSCPRLAQLGESLEACSQVRRRSKWVAGLLGIVPGAGYLVTGQEQTALAAMIVNGLLIGGAAEAFHADLEFLGATFSLFAVGWYAGSIHGSVSSVDRIHDSQWTDILNSVDLDTW